MQTIPVLSWNSVEVTEKGQDGLGDVKLALCLKLGGSHNVIQKVEPELIIIEVGAPKRKGMANMELLGFLAEVFDVTPEQVRIQQGIKESAKSVVIGGLRQSKRELVWFLEARVGKKMVAHHALDLLNAEREACSRQKAKREQEISEFQRLREEVCEESAKAVPMQTSSVAPTNTTGKAALLHMLGLKRKAEDLISPQAPKPAAQAKSMASELVVASVDKPSLGMQVMQLETIVGPDSTADQCPCEEKGALFPQPGLGSLSLYASASESSSSDCE